MRIGVHCQDFYRSLLYLWVTRRVSYKKQEQLTSREHLSSPTVFFGGVRIAHLFSFLCCLIVCLYIPCCDVRYDLHIKAMFSSYLLPIVLGGIINNPVQKTWMEWNQIWSKQSRGILLPQLCPLTSWFIQHFVLSYAFTFWIPYCDIRYVFRIKTMFGLFKPSVVCRRAHVVLMLFVFVWI